MRQKTKLVRTPVVVLLLCFATALAGCHEEAGLGDQDPDDADGDAMGGDIPLGMITVLSGPAAALGESGKKGMELAISEINADGGIDGRMIRGVYGDDKLDPTEGARVLQDMLAQHDVQAIVGALASGITAALIAPADDAEIVLMTPASTRPDLTQPRGSDYFFRIIPSDTIQGTKSAAIVFNDLEIDNVVVMFQNNAYATGLKDVFVAEYGRLGGSVSGEPITYHASDPATYPPVAQDAAARGASFIWIAGQYPEIGHLIKELRAAGYAGTIMASEAIRDAAIFDVAGADLDGVYFTWPLDEGSTAYSTFAAAFEAKHGEAPGPYSAYAYDATYIFADAFHAGKEQGSAIRDHVQAGSFSGRVSGTVSFNQDGDVASGDYFLWRLAYNNGVGSFEQV